MALPPTGLTTLLASAPRSPGGVVAVLRKHGCLTREARRSPVALEALLTKVLATASARPVMPGPSTDDIIAMTLRESPFLNEKGRRLGGGPPLVPWFRRWQAAVTSLWRG